MGLFSKLFGKGHSAVPLGEMSLAEIRGALAMTLVAWIMGGDNCEIVEATADDVAAWFDDSTITSYFSALGVDLVNGVALVQAGKIGELEECIQSSDKIVIMDQPTRKRLITSEPQIKAALIRVSRTLVHRGTSWVPAAGGDAEV